MKSLLDHGANPNSQDNAGRTPLSWAVACESTGVLMLSAISQVSNETLNTPDETGRTALSWAAGVGNFEAVRILLEKGADLNLADNSGRTPVSWAVGSGNLEVVKLFLNRKVSLFCEDWSGRTLLSYAAESGEEEIFKIMLSLQENPDAKDRNGRTPLSWLGGSGDKSSVKYRLRRRVAEGELVFNADFGGVGNENVVEMLLDKGVDMNSRDNNDRTPLSWAAGGGYTRVVEILLKRGAEVDSRDNTGRTPISFAVEGGHNDTVTLLLDVTDINVKNGSVRSLLELTVPTRQSQIMAQLIPLLWKEGENINTDAYVSSHMVSIRFRSLCGSCDREIVNTSFYYCSTCDDVIENSTHVCVDCFSNSNIRCCGNPQMFRCRINEAEI
jgi:ankyrin repeat protein